MEEKVIERIFEVSPDTVFGILVGLMAIALIWFARRDAVKEKSLD